MVNVRVVRVFTDRAGNFGNRAGVVFSPADLGRADRVAITAKLGLSETIFVDDAQTGRVQIYTPSGDLLPFAGHPLVGLSWLLHREGGRPPEALWPDTLPAPVPTFTDGQGVTWIRGPADGAPPWELVQLGSAGEVTALARPGRGGHWQKTHVWAWQDEAAGIVRARTFAWAYGTAEDEACGSACVLLTLACGRELTAYHGAGSMIMARPAGARHADVGGFVAEDPPVTV
jgi:predicted PhzF superfamily epimerase YddE/YHI9